MCSHDCRLLFEKKALDEVSGITDLRAIEVIISKRLRVKLMKMNLMIRPML